MSDLPRVPPSIRDSIRTLPVLPTAITRLLTLTRQGEVSVREIAGVIESDPTLMARTLRLANSSLYGTARQIKTAQQATVLLGIEAIVNLALSVSVASVQNSLHEQLPIDADAFGRHSVAVAVAARKLARRVRLPHPGEAFVAGLLHDIGKLVLLMHFGDPYAALMLRAHQGEKALHDLEREAYDLDHALAGHALCLHWNLPASMAEAVAAHHATPSPNTLEDVVSKANDLAKTLQMGHAGNCFIAAAPGTPGDLAGSGWLRALILDLQAELPEAEEALGRTKYGSYTAKKETHRPPVQLQIANPEEQAVFTGLLLALGFEPTETSDAALFDGPTRPAAIITDASPSERQRQAYRHLDVPVLDYAAFREEHGIAADGPLNVRRLGAWLSTLDAVGAPFA